MIDRRSDDYENKAIDRAEEVVRDGVRVITGPASVTCKTCGRIDHCMMRVIPIVCPCGGTRTIIDKG